MVHDLILSYELLIPCLECLLDVLHVVDEGALEELILSVQLHKGKDICLTKLLIAVHVKHHKCESLQQQSVLVLAWQILRVQQDRLNLLVEHVVLQLRIRPVKDAGHLLSQSSVVPFTQVTQNCLFGDFDVVDSMPGVIIIFVEVLLICLAQVAIHQQVSPLDVFSEIDGAIWLRSIRRLKQFEIQELSVQVKLDLLSAHRLELLWKNRPLVLSFPALRSCLSALHCALFLLHALLFRLLGLPYFETACLLIKLHLRLLSRPPSFNRGCVHILVINGLQFILFVDFSNLISVCRIHRLSNSIPGIKTLLVDN